MIPALESLEAYAERFTAPEPALLRRLRLETEQTHPLPQMLAGPLQGRLLMLLAKISGAERVLEIGTFVGYSTLCFAEGLPASGRVVTLDEDPSVREICRRYFALSPHGRKIQLKTGKALKLIPGLAGPFDLVYIDADKVNYGRYYDALFPKVRPGGLIVADNLLWSGAVLDKRVQDSDTRALRAFARKVRDDRRSEAALLTVRDGLMVIRKKENQAR